MEYNKENIEALPRGRTLERSTRFRRQCIIGVYIVDFYCHKAKLVVELDDSQHDSPEGIKHNQRRTRYLEAQGLFVLRCYNLDISRHFQSVCEHIDRTARLRVDSAFTGC